MSNFAYTAFDSHGYATKGTLDAVDQTEAIRRVKEMGYFPTKVVAERKKEKAEAVPNKPAKSSLSPRQNILSAGIPFTGATVNAKTLCVFTRQLATLIEAGMPLLRGLRILEEQEKNSALRRICRDLASAIEGGSSLSEALASHPKIFNRLYVNMVKAGELGGMLDLVLKRLTDFMEKAQKIKGKVVAAMYYPAAVMVVAVAIMGVLMVFVVPKFKEIFSGLLNGKPMPEFTLLVLRISEAVKNHFFLVAGGVAVLALLFRASISTRFGRHLFDRIKLKLPVFGPVIKKAAISRFARTFGTLVGSGVPILQTLTIVKETAGNLILSDAIAGVHESVKQGETITVPLKGSGLFPSIVIGMVDIGEQTGALPEMLMKIADNYDDEVDNAVASMTSLLEPIMIVFLAVIVGSIVIALFLPLIAVFNGLSDTETEI